MKAIVDWLDQRTGIRRLTQEALFENIPGGSRWRYVWGSTLTFTLAVQFITGIFLWMAYSPSSQTAWESVYYIQNEMTGGWFLRGLHHFTAQAMTVLLIFHLMQVVIDGAYKAPREVNFWFGLVLLMLTLALSLTGYLLPWDQKGYWATKVATNILAIVPFIGAALQNVVIGGSDYGHHTLTRFFALHAGILPGSIVVLLAGHIYLFRRHGITTAEPRTRPDAAFWPDQVLKDAVACLAVLAAVILLIVQHRLTSAHGALGAELAAPSDPSEQYSAARPEWYFLFLFQLLKYFPGRSEIVGAIILPNIIVVVLFLMPFIARRKLGHRFNLGFLSCLLAGAGFLTYLALAEDRRNSAYQLAVKGAQRDAERVRVLAHSPAGIPANGAVILLRNDPLTQGPKLFAKHCSSCHRFEGHDGNEKNPRDPPSAADLKGFASRAWIAGLLDPERVGTIHYFGGTKFKEGKMVKFVKKTIPELQAEGREDMKKIVAALSAEAQLKSQIADDQRDADLIKQGKILMKSEKMRCTECHQFQTRDEDATAPDLSGYGSRKWLLGILNNPAHPSYYGNRNDRMPAFGQNQILSDKDRTLLADWLRGEWYEPAH